VKPLNPRTLVCLLGWRRHSIQSFRMLLGIRFGVNFCER
jgi:hypothetical protein